MAWVRIESSAPRNRKFLRAGPASSWLYVCGLAYCQEGLTDGFIPEEALDALGPKQARRLVPPLVSAGLWDEVAGGWRIHDFLDYNWSSSEVRAVQVERRKAGRLGGQASGVSRRSKVLKQDAEANAKQLAEDAEANAKQPANPYTDTYADTNTDRGTAGVASPPRARPMAPLHDTSHKKHAHCGRVCVPASLHNEFTRRRNHLQADQELRDFYLDIEREWSGARADDEPGDAFDFWKARYAERWPSQSRAGQQRGGAPRSAPWHCPHVDRCANRAMCEQASILGRPVKAEAS